MMVSKSHASGDAGLQVFRGNSSGKKILGFTLKLNLVYFKLVDQLEYLNVMIFTMKVYLSMICCIELYYKLYW